MKEIIRELSDDYIDYDGEEYDDDEYQAYQELLEDLRFESSTYNY